MTTDDPDARTSHAESAARVAQIAILVRRLSDAIILNTFDSRARCRALATQVIQLMGEEDGYRISAQLIRESRENVDAARDRVGAGRAAGARRTRR